MNLRNNILNYTSNFPEENIYKEKILLFLDNCPLPYHRETKEGHVTASAFLLNSDKTKFLVMHHRKLGLWLQPGGHCDGDADVLSVAIKEAKEESGILDIKPVSSKIYDIDIHKFPANLQEPEHYHYDIRFLLQTVNNDYYIKNEESHDLKWIEFATTDSSDMIFDDSMKRMIKKFKLGEYL